MKEIDEMLNTWIHNSIIRKQLKKLIIKEITKSFFMVHQKNY